MQYPKVSIIIPVLNQKQHLQNAIESVINQIFTDYELIIIDGKSDDGTLDIIKKYESKISYWESTIDKNIYDAMNKGISKANGDWLYFLGADDKICKDAFQNIFSEELEDSILIFGNIIYQNNEEFNGELSNKLFIKNSIHHQGAVYHKRCFYAKKFNTQYSILADYDFNLSLFLENIKAYYFDFNFAICGNDGISKQKGWEHYKQEFDIKKNRLNAVQFIIYGSATLGKFLLNQIGVL
ncbi:MAG: glycosyltransferase [Flavobacteriales bacterium]|nr:glycosyltransferase [Flavobacteriales bacterium]